MEKTWRWFGKKDKITLAQLRQIGVEGIVTALHDVPLGQVWTREKIHELREYIESFGMRWSVVESLPVVETIKYGGPDRDHQIEVYKESLRNLSAEGIHCICYNFMPVLDWARTDLFHNNPNGATNLYFNYAEFAYFDIYILKRPGAREEWAQFKFPAGVGQGRDVLAECDQRGITRREITLHVGAGTFQPVKSEHIGDHPMHYEFISVPRDVIMDIINAPGPVIAVGTTSVRTLESLYYIGQILETNPDADEEALTVTQWMPYTTPCEISTQKALQNIVDYLDRHHADTYMGSTQLMIAPGFRYRIVSGMITNFHQPQSTLLLLVAAFVGQDKWRGMYDYALEHSFRFLSYGDAQLLLR